MISSREEESDRSPIFNRQKSKTPTFIYVVSALSAVGGFLFGYDTGVVSGAMILLRTEFKLTYIWQELVVSVTIAAAWLFSLVAGFLTDMLGRKPVIIMASFVFTGGAVLMGAALSKTVLLVGRIIVGAGIGLASMCVPMYIGEISPSEIRGKLVTLNTFFIVGGQFVASIVDGIFSDVENGWRYMLGLAAVPSFIQFFGFMCMPESPRWLIKKGRYQEALQVLKATRDPAANVEEEFETMKSNCIDSEREAQASGGGMVVLKVFKSPNMRRALLVGCCLQMFQQTAGINTVMYYSATIIEMSGVSSESKVIWLATATAGTNFAFTIVGLLLVERIGRRLLTLGSMGGVVFSLILLAVGFQLAGLNSSPIPTPYDNPGNKDCSSFRSCTDCVNSKSCGYCFIEQKNGSIGTCLLADENPHESIFPPCNGTTPEDNHVWAYEWCPSEYSWTILFGLLLYLLFFAPGMGPMPWTINAEIYPLWARGTCYSIATSVCWLFNLLVSMTFLTLTEVLTKYGTFWLYACISFLGWLFFFFMLPETKGKALEEVETLFIQPWWKDATTSDEKKTVQ